MKLIDEKGRFLGKINLIDFLAILFLLSLTPIFYFGYRIFFPKLQVATVETWPEFEVNMLCKFIKLEPEITEIISVGDKEYDSEGNIIGEIINLKETLPYSYEADFGTGRRKVKEDLNLKQMFANLKLRVTFKDNKTYYKDKPIIIDSPLDFKTEKYNIIMIPIMVETGLEERYVDLYLTLKDLDDKTASLISKGDRELDRDGKTMAEILSVGNVENNIFTFNLGSNSFARAEDSYKKQVSVRMRLRCRIQGNDNFYFKEKKIEYNSHIEFNTDEYKVNGIVPQTFEILPSFLKEKRLFIQVKFVGISPEISDIIREGDIEKDPSGTQQAKIRSILSKRPSEVLTLKGDNFITLKHPFYKDILVYLDVLCFEKEGTYYFKNYPVKIGNPIVFATDLYNISGTIIGLEIK